jgi:hypothetical protein
MNRFIGSSLAVATISAFALKITVNIAHITPITKVKCKVIPVQAVEVLRVARGWGSHIFRYSAHRWRQVCQPYAGRFLSPGRYLVLIFVRGWVDSRAIVRLEGLGKLKKKFTPSGTRTGDLPACSIVPEPTTLTRAPTSHITLVILPLATLVLPWNFFLLLNCFFTIYIVSEY